MLGQNLSGQLGDATNVSKNIPTLVSTANLSSGTSFTNISTGGSHTCGISSDGKAYCWGLSFGNLPSQLTYNVSFKSISAGSDHSCGISTNGTTYCWGQNDNNQIGDGTYRASSDPVPIRLRQTPSLISISAGHKFSCGIAINGATYCWGRNDNNQLGDGTTSRDSVPSLVKTDGLTSKTSYLGLKNLRNGYPTFAPTTCGVASDGKVYCWGPAENEPWGTRADIYNDSPAQVSSSSFNSNASLCSISAVGNHACGISSNGMAYCWGSNFYKQLGDASLNTKYVPSLVDTSNLSSGSSFKNISAGYSRTCGIASDGKTFCWGMGSTESIPTRLNTSNLRSGSSFITISTGFEHTCGISSDGKTYCWGSNPDGKLGDGSWISKYVPSLVNTSNLSPGSSFITISAGGSHTCGISSDGQTYCWGSNDVAQLGTDSFSSQTIPTVVNTANLRKGTSFISITAGLFHTCGLANDGRVYCWGKNLNGQLGDATNINKNIPTLVNSPISFKSISAGANSTCGLATDGNSYCWGGSKTVPTLIYQGPPK